MKILVDLDAGLDLTFQVVGDEEGGRGIRGSAHAVDED
jgi:hypothetical protein